MDRSTIVSERLVQRSFANTTASIRAARKFVRDTAAARGAEATLLDDIELAASEIVSNAVEHGSGDEFSILLTAENGRFAVEVTSGHDGHELAEPSDWLLPPKESLNGRGLHLVQAVSASSWLRHDDGTLTIGCHFEYT
jgi:anti-sigma regulatory factor (Ser/Thr protein kinase)